MTVEQLNELLGGGFPANRTYDVTKVTDRGCEVRLAVNDGHGRPGGTVSGPTMMTLADTAAWMAILSRIGPVVLAVTTSLHIDFLRKPAIADLIADADLLKLGTRLAIVDVRIHSEGSMDLVASAQVTYSIPPRR